VKLEETIAVRAGAVLMVLAVLAVSCGDAGGRDAARELPERGEVRQEELDDLRVRRWPASGEVEQGVRYRMTAYTHCGLDHLLDFDGSLWEVASGPDDPWAELGDPFDDGVIRLEADDVAVYESSTGAEFRLRRLEGPKDIHLCD
jgi:hypothetical protein